MSDLGSLERRYRRLLACYPRAFRREHEQEILSVLMAGAGGAQRWPTPGEAADLIRHGVWMRVRPRVPRSQPTVLWAVRLMYVCAALRLLGVPILPATRGSTAYPVAIGISWGVFAALAWANSRGYRWARALFALWFGIHSLALFYDLAHISMSSTAIPAVVASLAFWLLELSAAVLVLSKRSGLYYRQSPAQT